MNVRQHSKRLFTISLVTTLAGAGALLSVLAFPVSAAPEYRVGLRITLAFQAAATALAALLGLRLRYENRRARWRPALREESCISGQGERETENGGGVEPATQPTHDSPRQVTQRRSRSVEGMPDFEYRV